MKKLHFLNIVSFGILVTACSSHQPVQVVKGVDQSTFSHQEVKPVELPLNLPANVTAICRDGSYSTATTAYACSGNGGVKTVISHHHSE